MTCTRTQKPNAPFPISRPRALVGAMVMVVLSLGCASSGKRDPIQMPALSSLRAAAELLLDDAEERDSPPGWQHQERIEEGMLYGLGIHQGRGHRSHDLYLAMRSARDSILTWLAQQGAEAKAPRGLMPPPHLVRDSIDFERLAFDEKTSKWYVLARLDLAETAIAAATEVAELNTNLALAAARVSNDDSEDDERIRAALGILFALDRRHQLIVHHQVLAGTALAIPAELSDRALQEVADDMLANHGVRIVLEGPQLPGLYERVSGAVGEVHMRPDEFGAGLIVVTLVESDSFHRGYPYLEMDGVVQMAIEGGDARLKTETLHVVTTGVDIEEARYRAARNVGEEVGDILRRRLRELGAEGG